MTCGCEFLDSDCYTITGDGSSGDPFEVSYRVAPDADNLLECTEDGLSLVVPSLIRTPPMVRLRRGGPHAAANQPVSWTNVEFELGVNTGDFWTLGDPTKIYFPVDGLWSMRGSVRYEANNNGGRYVEIEHSVDGKVGSVLHKANEATAETTRFQTAAIWPSDSGDYVRIIINETSAQSPAAISSSESSIIFTMRYRGPIPGSFS